MIGLVSTVVTVDIPRRDRLFSGSICYRMRSCKSSNGVSSNAVEASKDSTVITIYTGVPVATLVTRGAPAPVLLERSAIPVTTRRARSGPWSPGTSCLASPVSWHSDRRQAIPKIDWKSA
jgi:hypothetical protein